MPHEPEDTGLEASTCMGGKEEIPASVLEIKTQRLLLFKGGHSKDPKVGV